ncbi:MULTISPECIES: hypothetical protein [Microbispora]|uniref:hypothetical protein n=1 Tax=Microbispora TaxID=2005 RepID=UPI0033D2D28F
MPEFTFDLVLQRPADRREQEAIFLVLVGTAGPYGEVSLTISRFPREATLLAKGLPKASLSHPDLLRQGYIPIDAETRLVVGGATASLARNRRALRREDRGFSIKLGERDYTYLFGSRGEELRESARGPLVRLSSVDPTGQKFALTVLSDADATDLALAIVLQGADTSGLSITGAIMSGVTSFFNGGYGDR